MGIFRCKSDAHFPARLKPETNAAKVPFDDGFEVMKTALDIDPDFETFHKFCIDNKIPFNVISAGLKPILRRVLDQFLGEEAVSLPYRRVIGSSC